ncbi:MAG TPA: EamA family transporter [Bryobacteraceae bacterium]|nr:EamA family transporter [Bryobacteraceae bacterium]
MSGRPLYPAYLALAAVCFFWGTLYLGIRIAVEAFPPMILMGGRFLAAGAVTLLVAAGCNAKMPSFREFRVSSFYGVITLGLGVGTLAIAVQWIPSGLAAILTTTTPFWMIGIEALLRGGERPNLPTLAGILVGMGGALLLVVPGAMQQGWSGSILVSFLVLQLGCGGFALGSILERRHDTTTHPIVNGAVQELATGIAFLIPAFLLPHNPVHWSFRALAVVLYLIVFGGIVGYSCYLYAMKHLPVSLVSIYTYVNPVVAVVVGSIIYGEKVGTLEIIAMIIIIAGVLTVKRYSNETIGEPRLQENLATEIACMEAGESRVSGRRDKWL